MWDTIEAARLRKQGLTQEQIGFVLGRIAEHRMAADHEGFKRGFESGSKERSAYNTRLVGDVGMR